LKITGIAMRKISKEDIKLRWPISRN